MTELLINADFGRRVVIDTNTLPWVASPQAGVQRRMIDRIGGEIARATSVVRYAADSEFPMHQHSLGEEFLVLEGVFSDENGDYSAGTYVRNPPNSRHTPRSRPGCTLLVKLRQMASTERLHVVVDTARGEWLPCEQRGHEHQTLFTSESEEVTLERLAAGVSLAPGSCTRGEELFILAGVLDDADGSYGVGTWIRNPAGHPRRYSSKSGVTFWTKRGHLPAGQSYPS